MIDRRTYLVGKIMEVYSGNHNLTIKAIIEKADHFIAEMDKTENKCEHPIEMVYAHDKYVGTKYELIYKVCLKCKMVIE